jgi:hypothetical protein
VPHRASVTELAGPTVFVNGAIQKIGELGRAQTPFTAFDIQVSFVDPATLLLMDTPTRPNQTPNNLPAGDYQVRAVERVSTVPGLATIDADGPDDLTVSAGIEFGDDDQQGGRNAQTTQSWESTIIGRLQMDGSDLSDGPRWALVNRAGTLGVWVTESDGTDVGDDLAFFEIDFSGAVPSMTQRRFFMANATATPAYLDLAEDPAMSLDPRHGESDTVFVDAAGRVLVIESDFSDPTQGEPSLYRVNVGDYDSLDANMLPVIRPANGAGFDETAAYAPAVGLNVPTGEEFDDDPEPLDSRLVAFDKGKGHLYVVDSENSTGFADEDVYVFDVSTGALVYHELDGVDPGILRAGALGFFTRGDANDDGLVNAADIDLLFAAVADPTRGGAVSASLGQEWYDLTGDGLLTSADMDELVREILGTEYGDHDLDGDVDGADLAAIRGGFATGAGWASGDNDGDGDVDGSDFLRWQQFAGFTNMPVIAAAVPEPGCGVLAALGCGAAWRKRRSGFLA